LNETRERAQAIEEALDSWMGECTRIQEDPRHIPSLTSAGCNIKDDIMQFASELCDKISEFFLCRSGQTNDYTADLSGLPCGFFGPNTNWAGTPSAMAGQGGQWRCPHCGTEFYPWKSKPSWRKANKLLVIEGDGIETEFENISGAGLSPTATDNVSSAGAASSSGAGLPPMATETGGVRFIPFQWEDTKTSALHNRLKELQLQKYDDQLKDQILLATAEATQEAMNASDIALCEKIKTISLQSMIRKSYFGEMRMSPQARRLIEEANSRATGGKTFVYSHLEGTFQGARYIWHQDEVIYTQDDIAKMWATIRVACKRANAARVARDAQ
jgi:hypothetical protein